MANEYKVLKIFSKNFREILYEKNIQQIELHRKFGFATSAIQKWVNGTAIPTPQNMDLLSGYLECQICDFFKEERINNLKVKNHKEYV